MTTPAAPQAAPSAVAELLEAVKVYDALPLWSVASLKEQTAILDARHALRAAAEAVRAEMGAGIPLSEFFDKVRQQAARAALRPIAELIRQLLVEGYKSSATSITVRESVVYEIDEAIRKAMAVDPPPEGC